MLFDCTDVRTRITTAARTKLNSCHSSYSCEITLAKTCRPAGVAGYWMENEPNIIAITRLAKTLFVPPEQTTLMRCIVVYHQDSDCNEIIRLRSSVAKQYNKLCSSAGKVTAGMGESNGSLPSGKVTWGLTAKRPGSALSSTLVNRALYYFTFYYYFTTPKVFADREKLLRHKAVYA